MQYLVNRFKALDAPDKAHFCALLIFGISVLLSGQKAIQQTFLLLSSFGFAAGFLLWSWPFIVKTWEHLVGRTLIIIVHLFVLILAAAFARNVVAAALKLPPQNFEIALSFTTLLFYIPAWSVVVSVAVGIIAIFHELFAFLGAFAKSPTSHIAKHLAQMAGAFAVCYFSAMLPQFVFDNEKTLHPAIKWVAFFGDYQVMDLYPGNSPNERVRLHDNGVVSSARMEKNQVLIEVRKYKD